MIALDPGSNRKVILNWCLAGQKWYYGIGSRRLVKPRKVSQATANLRTVSDTVRLFLAGECAFEAGAMLSRSAFREMFEKWCSEEGIRRVPTGKRVGEALRERGVTDGVKIHGERYWSGIWWKNENERNEFEKSGGVPGCPEKCNLTCVLVGGRGGT